MLDATSLPRGYAVRCNIVAIQYTITAIAYKKSYDQM